MIAASADRHPERRVSARPVVEVVVEEHTRVAQPMGDEGSFGLPVETYDGPLRGRPIIAATRQRYSACRHGIGAKHLISRTCTPSTLVVRSTGPAEQADIVAELTCALASSMMRR